MEESLQIKNASSEVVTAGICNFLWPENKIAKKAGNHLRKLGFKMSQRYDPGPSLNVVSTGFNPNHLSSNKERAMHYSPISLIPQRYGRQCCGHSK